MFNQPKPVRRQNYSYSNSLLQERQQELHALEQKHREGQIPPDDYRSCRRSLLQAISELRSILPNDPESETPDKLHRTG